MSFKNVIFDSCPVCGSTKRDIFYELVDVPTSCNMLWADRDKALNCPKGNISLGLCQNCTFIYNYALQPEKNQYDNRYDNSLTYSKLFQDFAKKFVLDLIEKFDLHDKVVMEATVGKVDFLSFFCSLGSNEGLRFDTSFINSLGDVKPHDFLKAVSDIPLGVLKKRGVNFVFSYHELEHANDPVHFLNELKDAVGENSKAVFYTSVPNIYKAFREGDFTDVMYEHACYFTIASLRYIFTKCGFFIRNIMEEGAGFYSSVCVEATLDRYPESSFRIDPNEYSQVKLMALDFAKRSFSLVEKAKEDLCPVLDQGKHVVVWGAGARGVTFLNIIKDSRIKYAVDINPNKQGNFIPGTGQEIIAPKVLVSYRPDVVVVLNPSYLNEIKKTLSELQLDPKFYLL